MLSPMVWVCKNYMESLLLHSISLHDNTMCVYTIEIANIGHSRLEGNFFTEKTISSYDS